MVFTVGYPHDQRLAGGFAGLVSGYPQISEVYFAVPGRPSGRHPLDAGHLGFVRNLAACRAAGKRLNMLLNPSCDGASYMTAALLGRVARDLDALAEHGCRPDSVTVTSLRTAAFVKEREPDVKVRVSVINGVRSAAAMSYFGAAADGFYAAQDLNRDVAALRRIKGWCESEGKELCLLANSSCLADCPFRAEHYNTIAHMGEIGAALAAEGSSLAACADRTVPCQASAAGGNPYLPALRGTWIPPRSVGRYEGLCDMMKLSTRMHPDPGTVFDAYCLGADCDVLDVLGERLSLTAGARLPQSGLPEEMFEKFLVCRARGCDECGYCEALAARLAGRG